MKKFLILFFLASGLDAATQVKMLVYPAPSRTVTPGTIYWQEVCTAVPTETPIPTLTPIPTNTLVPTATNIITPLATYYYPKNEAITNTSTSASTLYGPFGCASSMIADSLSLTNGITFLVDTNLYRNAENVLKTDDSFEAADYYGNEYQIPEFSLPDKDKIFSNAQELIDALTDVDEHGHDMMDVGVVKDAIGYLNYLAENHYYPCEICRAGDYLYITDTNNHRVVKRALDLTYVDKIGTSGSGNDQFSYPRGICTDGTYLYITDTRNSRIVKRTKTLVFIKTWGSLGSKMSECVFPSFPCYIPTTGDVALTDYGTNIVKVLSGGILNGNSVEKWSGDVKYLDALRNLLNIAKINCSGQITSTLATGTAPLAVTSTTKCTNLNVDSVDDIHFVKGGPITMASGVVVITDAFITTSSQVMMMRTGGTVATIGDTIVAQGAGAATITSTNALDDSVFKYTLIK